MLKEEARVFLGVRAKDVFLFRILSHGMGCLPKHRIPAGACRPDSCDPGTSPFGPRQRSPRYMCLFVEQLPKRYMGSRGEHLAEFEVCVMAALAHLHGDAPGGDIRREIERRGKRIVAIGAVYATLARLEAKGYVRFYIEGPRPTPGGRARKHAVLTASGQRALRRTATMFDRMLEGLTPRVIT